MAFCCLTSLLEMSRGSVEQKHHQFGMISRVFTEARPYADVVARRLLDEERGKGAMWSDVFSFQEAGSLVFQPSILRGFDVKLWGFVAQESKKKRKVR